MKVWMGIIIISLISITYAFEYTNPDLPKLDSKIEQCSASNYIYAIRNNGDILCRPDVAGGVEVDTSAYINCSTDEVFLGNGSCWGVATFPAGVESDPHWTANLTDGLVENLTTSEWFNGLFNWTTADRFNIFTGSILTYNQTALNESIDLKLTTTIYYPNQTVTIGGVNLSNNITLMWYDDDLSYNITEGGGVNPFGFYINYTDVSDFSEWIIQEYYVGSASHHVRFELWNYDTSDWESHYEIVGQSGFSTIVIPIFDSEVHIQNGIVQTKFHHVENGITSHRFKVDFSWLTYGVSIGASANLAGFAKYSFGTNSFNGSGNFNTTGNVTANYISVDHIAEKTTGHGIAFDNDVEFQGGTFNDDVTVTGTSNIIFDKGWGLQWGDFDAWIWAEDVEGNIHIWSDDGDITLDAGGGDIFGGTANFQIGRVAQSNPSRVRVYKTSNQVLTTATWTTVDWHAETYDQRGEFNLATDRFTPDESGYYLIVWQARLNNILNVGNAFHIRVLKGAGATEIARSVWETPATSTRNVYINMQTVVYLTATTDYIYFRAYQNTGANQNLNGDAGGIWCHAEIHRLS